MNTTQQTKIKFCGLTRSEDIRIANALRPDFIGFVFAPQSRRYVPPEQAAILKDMLDPSIRSVGVFVRETPEQIAALLRAGIIDIAQLHGGESEEDIRALRTLTDRPVIKAFRIDSEADLPAVIRSTADFVLLDSGAGGTGTVFDWHTADSLRRPYFLAGGLTPENVGDAVRRLHPYAVDVSSGIETDGIKDPLKMTAFLQHARHAAKKST